MAVVVLGLVTVAPRLASGLLDGARFRAWLEGEMAPTVLTYATADVSWSGAIRLRGFSIGEESDDYGWRVNADEVEGRIGLRALLTRQLRIGPLRARGVTLSLAQRGQATPATPPSPATPQPGAEDSEAWSVVLRDLDLETITSLTANDWSLTGTLRLRGDAEVSRDDSLALPRALVQDDQQPDVGLDLPGGAAETDLAAKAAGDAERCGIRKVQVGPPYLSYHEAIGPQTKTSSRSSTRIRGQATLRAP